MKGKRRLTSRRAVWAGLLATPVLIAIVAAIGVAAAPAGPGTPAAPAATAADMQVVHSPVRQTARRGRGVLD